jgi:hypothetical protein
MRTVGWVECDNGSRVLDVACSAPAQKYTTFPAYLYDNEGRKYRKMGYDPFRHIIRYYSPSPRDLEESSHAE